MGDSEINMNNADFDIQTELSSLVAKKAIPKKIADRLGQRLIQKNIKITKEQLHLLVNKINSLINNYPQFNQDESKNTTTFDENNMQKLVETIEKLEERLDKIEHEIPDENIYPGKKGKTRSSKIVTTDDIHVDEDITGSVKSWKVNPLTEIPSDPESIIVLMKWLQYLIDKCGRANLGNILDYYVDIGWITQDAKMSLIDYSHGITDDTNNQQATNNVTDLPSKDHIQSFIYIQKLKGKELDKHFIDRIDSELSRLTKKLDNYSLK